MDVKEKDAIIARIIEKHAQNPVDLTLRDIITNVSRINKKFESEKKTPISSASFTISYTDLPKWQALDPAQQFGFKGNLAAELESSDHWDAGRPRPTAISENPSAGTLTFSFEY